MQTWDYRSSLPSSTSQRDTEYKLIPDRPATIKRGVLIRTTGLRSALELSLCFTREKTVNALIPDQLGPAKHISMTDPRSAITFSFRFKLLDGGHNLTPNQPINASSLSITRVVIGQFLNIRKLSRCLFKGVSCFSSVVLLNIVLSTQWQLNLYSFISPERRVYRL